MFPVSFSDVAIDDVKSVIDPLNKVQPGLRAGGQSVPLQAVHVRAKLMDLSAQVGNTTCGFKEGSSFSKSSMTSSKAG